MPNKEMDHAVWQEGEDRPGDQACDRIIGQVFHPQIHGPAREDETEQHGKVVTPGGPKSRLPGKAMATMAGVMSVVARFQPCG